MMLAFVNRIKREHRRNAALAARAVVILIGAGACSGCGFHLAGAGRLPPEMQSTFLQSGEPRSDFYASLTAALRQRGLSLAARPGDASARIIISEDTTGQRVLSVTARNIPREYEVYYSIRFSLEAEGQQLIEPEQLIARRNYTYDETEVLGKEREESLLRRALAEDLARQVVRRIEALSPG